MSLYRMMVALWLGPWALAAWALAPAAKPVQPPSRFSALVAEARLRVPEIEVGDLRGLLKTRQDLMLIDVREDAEWKAGRIPGALHMSKGVIERDIEALVRDPDALVVLYCGSGGRSLLAGENLARMGYTGVVSLRGGFKAWLEAGLIIEQEPPEFEPARL